MPKRASAVKKSLVRGSRSGRPIMALLDLLGRRWTLRILWELRGDALTSRALRTGLRRSLSDRAAGAAMSDLREAGFVALAAEGGYSLTPLSAGSCRKRAPLHRFAERWRKR